ncbi:sigma-70 family RNA polymerase sigma factor [Sphingomonas sp. So64.6b]|uniref:ECF-type sigma factor n=1 Tax=Sphingomonas sp. So64.6b TaxID=2997354 RepID=UPI0016047490|nr:ECF-type sigma factor [Sphingomonas sp. So64.6b]QNA83694.1 sigma-70 family RNA polymerase sigma factor [Sphingomonas sp. So64.6b]
MTANLKIEGSDTLVGALYQDLRKAAHRELRRAGSPQTWQTTAIINETWLKLHTRDDWESREHFIRTASTAMRHVMIDAARARLALRRGGGVPSLPIEAADDVAAGDLDDDTLIRLGETLGELAELDPDLARLVDCRYFAGLTEAETARVLDISDRTVRRRWVQARAWIHRSMLEQ